VRVHACLNWLYINTAELVRRQSNLERGCGKVINSWGISSEDGIAAALTNFQPY